ncbi:MAG: hypothetical protein V3V99_06970 [candidate division Zixibacteria bacterium]
MHPDKEKLSLYVEGRLGDTDSDLIAKHLTQCEFCCEFCDNYVLLSKSMELSETENLPPEALDLADRLFKHSIKSNIIELKLLGSSYGRVNHLAADGNEIKRERTKNIATLYSQDPEVVLRVMHDSKQKHDYLQLISDDINLVSRVMIQLPELGHEFITDENGYADARDTVLRDCDKLKWQIKMPDAIFNLEPLVYDPEKVEYQEGTIFETEKHDKIRITFQGKTVGKQITLQILELEGSSDFDTIKVVVSQGKATKIIDAGPDEAVTFDISDPANPINIRLFQ